MGTDHKLSDFEKASGKIEVACLECGHEWPTTVTTLRNSSCKPCGYKRNAAKRLRQRPPEFIEEIGLECAILQFLLMFHLIHSMKLNQTSF